jgi:hypothetical protein
MGRNLPNEEIIEQLCALSGDDPDLVMAQVQAARAKDAPARAMWSRIAARLSSGAGTAILSVLFSIILIAAPAGSARATGLKALKSQCVDFIYIVSTGVFVRLERLRQRTKGLPGFLRLCWLSWC